MNFAVGDVVMLKSGGPVMTVDQNADGQVLCYWFDGSDRKVGRFSVGAVERYTPPEPQRGEDYDPYADNGRNRTTGY